MTSQAAVRSDDDSSVISPRALAELARAGSAILRQPSMRLAYEVHHVKDRPGYLHDILNGRYSALFGMKNERPRFIEALTTAANGVGLVVGTRTVGPDLDAQARRTDMTPTMVRQVDDPTSGSRIFRGTIVPNVSFVHETSQVFEGLISIEVEQVQVQLSHCRAILAVVGEIADVAVTVASAPILSLQSPVQVPLYSEWPRSSAVAVRFTIALDQPSADLRLKIAEAFASFCAERGFGLWVADSRPGYRGGNWFMICPHNTAGVHDRFGDAAGERGGDPVSTCLPITFVGPARTGSTRSVLAFLSRFPEVGLLAFSGTIIEDIAFIHMQLTTNTPAARLDQLNATLDTVASPGKITPLDDNPSVLLPRILPLLVRQDSPLGLAVPHEHGDRAGDYHTLVGQALPVDHAANNDRRALWVSWEVEGQQAELSLPFMALCSALKDFGLLTTDEGPKADSTTDANLEYLICRHMGNSVLRGKGKLSFPGELASRNFGHSGLHTGLSIFSAGIEKAWRDRLDKAHRVRELTVSAREYWLGHWSLPLD